MEKEFSGIRAAFVIQFTVRLRKKPDPGENLHRHLRENLDTQTKRKRKGKRKKEENFVVIDHGKCF